MIRCDYDFCDSSSKKQKKIIAQHIKKNSECKKEEEGISRKKKRASECGVNDPSTEVCNDDDDCDRS
jgi:hypothetical protein